MVTTKYPDIPSPSTPTPVSNSPTGRLQGPGLDLKKVNVVFSEDTGVSWNG